MLAWYTGAMIRHNESARLTMDPCVARPSVRPYVPPSLGRAIAARWQIWVPLVRMYLLRARASLIRPSARQWTALNPVACASVTRNSSLP